MDSPQFALPKISVIVSTYNSEAWLEKVLWGFHCQTFQHFELVVADDGSGPKTKALVASLSQQLCYTIIHVWQEDTGFQKSKILNKAIAACNAPYIIMTDGDCIPREDFVEVHYTHSEKGYFISGGYFMLPMDISKRITLEDIKQQRCFNLRWLKQQGLPNTFKNTKLTARGFVSRLLNFFTPTNASWNGHNASGWKEDIIKVNGFDERMQYGGQDRELGERLLNAGIKSKQLRYSAVCVHLDHERGYKTAASMAKNRAIRQETRSKKLVWTPHGITKP